MTDEERAVLDAAEAWREWRQGAGFPWNTPESHLRIAVDANFAEDREHDYYIDRPGCNCCNPIDASHQAR